MISCVLLVSAVLAGQTVAPKAKPPEKAATPIDRQIDPGEALAKYNELHEKTAQTAADQWKLGIWCEQHGLKAEAYLHFAEVVRRDPKREAAWRKLGYKKSGGRWTTDEQIAEDTEQKKADKVWAPRLKKVHKDIHRAEGDRRRSQAQAVLDAITDARAIPSLYREFGGSQTDQIILIQVLAHIEKPIATRVLAMLAVYGRTPEVRRRATEFLRGRAAEDYLDLLVGLLKDPVKYEVRPVGGPGSPGVLLVEGQRFNTARFYAPPPPPNVVPRPGDMISYDQFGMPVITRDLGLIGNRAGVPGSKTLAYQNDVAVQFSATQMMLEAQKGARAAEAQLESDVARIKTINDNRRRFNELVMAVASYATGKSPGHEPKDWRKAVGGNAEEKYVKEPSQKPTVTLMVALGYNPTFANLGFMTHLVVDS